MNNAPIFVKIDKFREISTLIDEIRAKLKETQTALNKLEQLKDEEDRELAEWKAEITSAEDRIDAIERVITQQ